jgi:hypothetical protein
MYFLIYVSKKDDSEKSFQEKEMNKDSQYKNNIRADAIRHFDTDA